MIVVSLTSSNHISYSTPNQKFNFEKDNLSHTIEKECYDANEKENPFSYKVKSRTKNVLNIMGLSES